MVEAANQFGAAHKPVAACIGYATGNQNVGTNQETICRTVIGWVCLSLSARPEEAERVSNQLEMELQSILDTQGFASQKPNP